MINIIHKIESFLQITHNGYVEHFIVGLIISAFISYLTFKRTRSYWLAFLFGMIVLNLIGLFKEFVDPYIRGDRSKLDMILTGLGGLIGLIVVFVIQKVKRKVVL